MSFFLSSDICSDSILMNIHTFFTMCPSVINSNKNLNWKYKLFIGLLICTTTTTTTILLYLNGNQNLLEQVTSALRGGDLEQFSQKEIIILHWSTFWGNVFPPTLFNPDNCSILKTATTQRPPISRIFDKPCTITFDRRYLNESHAVVFHSSNLNYWPPYSYRNLPKGIRPQNQIWVWYQGESPLTTVVNPNVYKDIFNWTMSYRRDSDVYYPYAYIVPWNISTSSSPRPTAHDNPPDHYRESLKSKSGLAAMIASKCDVPSKRENFVAELQQYMQVDIFGTCGDKKCPRPRNEGFYPCYNHIQSKYKFYLSFENSLCVDYITEKFFIALQTSMVPVVYGGGIDDQMGYLAIAPQNSFIDARDFKSPKDLAHYLIYLDNNDDEYLKYFEWKDKYQVIYQDYGQFGLGWCNLCQRVYEEQLSKREGLLRNKWYSDLYTWWNYVQVSQNLSTRLPLSSQSKSKVSPIGQSFQYSLEKLKPACVLPKANFNSYEKYEKSN